MFSWRDVESVLIRAGFVFDRQKGSHIVYYHPTTHRTVVFPKHREILREMDLTETEFRKLLEK
jgi:predicted RNA binding protein YcfA (HicA-like mRNA interferase family)